MPRASPERKAPQTEKERPVHTIRHRRIKASIWRNITEKGPMYNVTIVRGFNDGESWKDSHSFGYDDLPVVAKILNDCHSYITNLRSKERSAKPNASSKSANSQIQSRESDISY